MQSKQNLNGSNFGNLTFGFDIGIASVGWAVLNETRIVDLGVRAFDAAEDPEDGTPHNQKRRGGRVARNRLHTRAWRLKRLRRLLRDAGLISSADFQNINQKPRKKGGEETSPWTLRSKALTDKLSPNDWARVIYHLVKHRGFGVLSQSELEIDSDVPTSNAEKASLTDGLRRNSALLKKHKTSLKTLGNIAVQLPNLEPDSEDGQSFKLSIRNKGKNYHHTFLRADLRDELETLFIEQERLGNPFINIAIPEIKAPFKLVNIGGEKKEVPLTFKEQVFALFDMQKPPISTEQMKGLIGNCEFEEGEKRAPKNSFSNERSTWLQKLNGIKVRRNGKEEFLTPVERLALINLPYEKEKITYNDIRDVLCQVTGFSRDWREASFNMLSYRPKIKADAGWINVLDSNNVTSLNKYNNFTDKDQLKETKKKLKDTLRNSTITYAELRTLFNVPEHCKFQHAHKEQELIQKELEAVHAIPFSADDSEYILKDGITYKINLQKTNKSNKLSKKSYALLAELKKSKPEAALTDLRIIVERTESINEPWLFEFNQTARVEISSSIEADTRVPIEYENVQSVEGSTCIELKGWHKLRKALAQQCPDFWQSLAVVYQQSTSAQGKETAGQLDEIVHILAIYQTDFERCRELSLRGIKEEVISELLKINLRDFRNLSIKFLRNILPFLEEGHVFDKACKQAGYNHSERPAQLRKTTLDPFETYQFERWRSRNDGGIALMTKEETRYKDLNNPTVARALNQARRVLNALVEKYDSPAYINVELARDLSRSKRLRDKIKNEQDTRREDNENADKLLKEKFRNEFQINDPAGSQLLRYKLYLEQECQCAYTYPPLPKGLDLDRVIRDESYTQIDHIWPKSSTFDNSLNNRILVLAGANQNKGDDIPWDFFGKKDTTHWRHFQAWVNSCKGMSKEKQDRLLAKELNADEFAARNLVDTRYVTKLFARILRERLIFAGGATEDFAEIDNDEAGKDKLEKFYRSRVRTPQGGAISFLRRCWGLQKVREESDLHHALDACVIAATSPSLIKQVNDFNRREEQFPYRYKKDDDGNFVDTKTGEVLTKDEALEAGVFFPRPWEHFREEVLARLSSDGRTYQTKKGERRIYDFANYSQDELNQVNPVLVSRLVKKKRNTELHDANPMGLRFYPVKLQDLTLEMLEQAISLPSLPERRKNLVLAIKNQLAASDGDASLAFADGFVTTNKKGKEEFIHTIPLPMISLPKGYLGNQKSLFKGENFSDSAKKIIPLSKLSLIEKDNQKVIKGLTEKDLGVTFYTRNMRLIKSLETRLIEFDGDAEKAFTEPFYPFGMGDSRPFIRSIRVPAPRGSGIFVRGGVANLGDALYTEVYKHEGTYWFKARYKVAKEKTFGLPVMPDGAKFICNFSKNDFVRIKHPNLACCYREISRHKDAHGNIFINVESVFDDGVFEGYWNYFEPSNDRPAVQLQDGREFFLLEDGKTFDKKTLTLIAKLKIQKKPEAKEEWEYFEFGENPECHPLKFSLVSDIKRKVGDASFIEKVKIDVLGCVEKKQDGLA